MNLGPQMADISVDNQRANFNTGPYGTPPPLKIKILKIRSDENLPACLEVLHAEFYDDPTSNKKD